MYSTCLFCNGTLGANEAIETFPVGRRLAFDAAKGRLWVVCRHCERWNLTPLEERWEAIEECERAFRDTRLRVSTDEIGLARLREGLELVRIGAPQRPEMAAWRYGDQFGRRRLRTMLFGGVAVAAVGGYLIAGPVLGLMTVGAGGSGVFNLVNAGRNIYRARSVAARIPMGESTSLVVRRNMLDATTMRWDARASDWSLDVAHGTAFLGDGPWWHLATERTKSTLIGDDAMRAARLLLPAVNASGANRRTVGEAVDYLERSDDPGALFARTAKIYGERKGGRNPDKAVKLGALPANVRLALEMSAHEESERRALDGELHLLESSWREAEEIAAIADDMFLPASVEEDLARLKRKR